MTAMMARFRTIHFLIALFTWLLLLTVSGSEKKAAAVSKAMAASIEQTQPYTTTSDVKVRSGPGAQYKVVAEIKSGTKVNAVATDGEWLKIVSKQGNPPGYIPERYARPTGEPIKRKSSFVEGSYIATANTYVKEGPGLHYKTVAKITKGTKFQVVDAEGDWLKVQSKHGNPPGYIEKKSAQRNPGN